MAESGFPMVTWGRRGGGCLLVGSSCVPSCLPGSRWLAVGEGPAHPDRREPERPGRGPRGRGPGRRLPPPSWVLSLRGRALGAGRAHSGSPALGAIRGL